MSELDLDVIRHGEYGAIPVVEQLIEELERLREAAEFAIADGTSREFVLQKLSAALHAEGGGDG